MQQIKTYEFPHRLLKYSIRALILYMGVCCLDMMVYRTTLRNYMTLPVWTPDYNRVYIYDHERYDSQLHKLALEIERSE